MSHLCDAKKKKSEEDASRAAERQAEGKTVFACERCKRTSHKEEHLCKPVKVKSDAKVSAPTA